LVLGGDGDRGGVVGGTDGGRGGGLCARGLLDHRVQGRLGRGFVGDDASGGGRRARLLDVRLAGVGLGAGSLRGLVLDSLAVHRLAGTALLAVCVVRRSPFVVGVFVYQLRDRKSVV